MKIKGLIVRKGEKKDIRKIAKAFKDAFEGPPWFERWSIRDAEKEIKNYFQREAKILVAEIENKIIGFSVIVEIKEKMIKGIVVPEVYGAEFAIVQEMQGKGIGKTLMEERKKLLKENNIDEYCFRTINPIMVDLTSKFFDVEKIGKEKGDVYENRIWYRVKIKD